MANVEDAERTKLVIRRLQGQYAAHQFTSNTNALPSNQLRVMFHSPGRSHAAAQKYVIGRIAEESAAAADLSAKVTGPEYAPTGHTTYLCTVLISIRNRNDPEALDHGQISQQPTPETLTDRCFW